MAVMSNSSSLGSIGSRKLNTEKNSNLVQLISCQHTTINVIFHKLYWNGQRKIYDHWDTNQLKVHCTLYNKTKLNEINLSAIHHISS